MPQQGKTNFLYASTEAEEEKKAFQELAHYLIGIGNYDNIYEVVFDSIERIDFFTKQGLYEEDVNLCNASLVSSEAQN